MSSVISGTAQRHPAGHPKASFFAAAPRRPVWQNCVSSSFNSIIFRLMFSFQPLNPLEITMGIIDKTQEVLTGQAPQEHSKATAIGAGTMVSRCLGDLRVYLGCLGLGSEGRSPKFSHCSPRLPSTNASLFSPFLLPISAAAGLPRHLSRLPYRPADHHCHHHCRWCRCD